MMKVLLKGKRVVENIDQPLYIVLKNSKNYVIHFDYLNLLKIDKYLLKNKVGVLVESY